MSFAPPPPPPPLLSPPMVAMGLPPPSLPPPPMAGITPQIPVLIPPPPIPLPVVARPNQLLFTNVPTFLHNIRTIRDWIMSVGGTRSVLLLPPPPRTMDGRVRNENDNSLSIDWKKTEGTITALATMTNPDVAIRVVSAFRYMALTHLKEHKDESLRNFYVHPVPNNPDVPLPPIMMMDPDVVTTTGEAMYSALLRCRDGGDITAVVGDIGPNHTHTESGNGNNNNNTSSSNSGNIGTNDDRTGNYNDDNEGNHIDPLESPAVLEAVRQFREHLATLQGSKATKRQQLVSDAIAKELPVMRQRMTQERAAAAAAVANAATVPSLPPPHPMILTGMQLPPPPPPPPVSSIHHAPRGVSNQPAWMTQQQQEQQVTSSSVNDEPPTKRMKVDVTDPTLVFPMITTPDKVATLRQYISHQIQHYLGEAEETLVTFVLDRLTTTPNANVASLLPELTEVLDDDAVVFLQSIYEYSQQLSAVQ